MSDITRDAYLEVVHYIKTHFDEVRETALKVIEREGLMEDLHERREEYIDQPHFSDQDWEGLVDHWDSHGDSVDLHIVNDGGHRLRCIAYPVINDKPCYDMGMNTEIPL